MHSYIYIREINRKIATSYIVMVNLMFNNTLGVFETSF